MECPFIESLVCDPEKSPSKARFEPRIFRSRGGRLNHSDKEAIQTVRSSNTMSSGHLTHDRLSYHHISLQPSDDHCDGWHPAHYHHHRGKGEWFSASRTCSLVLSQKKKKKGIVWALRVLWKNTTIQPWGWVQKQCFHRCGNTEGFKAQQRHTIFHKTELLLKCMRNPWQPPT